MRASEKIETGFAAEFEKADWCSILTKVNKWVMLGVLLMLGSKMTFVLFSWLNDTLAPVNFWIVCTLVFFIGAGMFLLPPVPGSAVYIFAGVVIGAKAQKEEAISFWTGVVIACLLGLVAKLLACVGQYGIGFAAGKYVSVQKFIGVDTVPIRAIEMILNKQGLAIGKVALLVGGPDWPTSVTCGILRLNIPQMILGTLPVFIASIAPQTLAGALLTKAGSVWSMVANAATGIAFVCQTAATLTYMLVLMKTIDEYGEQLAQYREEHKAVAELTEKERAYQECFKAVSQWKELSRCSKPVILMSVVMSLITMFLFGLDFVLDENICFRKFEIVSSISASISHGGLDNNVINIVIQPVGWVALGTFLAAIILHTIHGKTMAFKARKKLTSQGGFDYEMRRDSEKPGSPPPVSPSPEQIGNVTPTMSKNADAGSLHKSTSSVSKKSSKSTLKSPSGKPKGKE